MSAQSFDQQQKNRNKDHGATVKVHQFPLRLAWASTGHKLQGATIKKGSNIVAHGHRNMPDGLYYVMLSRTQAMENLFLENFLPNKLKANAEALEEDNKLKNRCILPSFEGIHFNFFVLNIRSWNKHCIDLANDIYASKSDHICVVETWINPEYDVSCNFQDRTFEHASLGIGKGCAIASLSSRQTIYDSKVIKEHYQIMSIIDESIQLILVYSSQNCPIIHLVQDLRRIIRSDLIPVITGDFNFHKTDKNALTKFLFGNNFVQLVQLPTHDKKGNTLDHCYVPEDKKDKIHVKLHSPYYSDHDALLISFQND